MVCYAGAGRKTAFELCAELRKQGLAVELDVANSTAGEAENYARSRNIGGVIRIVDEESVEINYPVSTCSSSI